MEEGQLYRHELCRWIFEKCLGENMEKKIYLVGGAVRDALMGIPQKEKDYVAVGYSVEDFSHLKSIGKDFPIFIQDDGSELALARKDSSSGENEGLHVSIEEDLKRRDLTINSIAYDPIKDTYVDPYGGRRDIANRCLRHTSAAFVEDPLRVLRVARFRAYFGQDWKIHPSTKALIYSMRERLYGLKPERVWKEIEKVLEFKESALFFETLFELGVLDVIFPSLYALTTLKEGTPFHQESSVFVHTMMVLRHLEEASPLLKLTALYHDIAKPYTYRHFGNSSNHEDKQYVSALIDMPIPHKLKQTMLFLIARHIKVSLLHEMKPAKIATFFEGFKKDKALLLDFLTFVEADHKGRISDIPRKPLDRDLVLEVFDRVASYSPKGWIEAQTKPLRGEMIAQHIHLHAIDVVKHTFKKGAKI